jgi:hypothetical protein
MAASAGSIDPDLKRLIREAEKPKVHYGPARVGWNAPATTVADARVANPVYESLRRDSPAAIRAELKAVLIPDWQVWLAMAALIFGIRRLRSSVGVIPAERVPATVIAFPPPRTSQHEAA